jgi:hypothetical protein
VADGFKTGGRQKGTPNKITALLKDAIVKAATDAGDGDVSEYLRRQAIANPGPFMALLGKVLPMGVVGDEDADPIQVVHKIERIIVDPAN